MQPIDVVGTLRRGWRLLVVLAIVFAIVAVLIPQSSGSKAKKSSAAAVKLHWKADAVVGSAPPGGTSYLGGGVTPSQIVFYANTYVVRGLALILAHMKVGAFEQTLYLQAATTTQAAVSSAATATTAAGKTSKRAGASGLVALTANAKTGAEAVRLANAYSTALGRYLTDLAKNRTAQQASSGSGTTTPVDTGFQVVVPALVATKVKATKGSITSSRKVRGAIGLVLGLAVAAAILLLREVLDRRLRDAVGTEKSFGYPVVIEIPAPDDAQGELISPPTSPAAEAYRRLRMSLSFEHLAAASGAQDELATFFGQAADSAASSTAVAEIGARQIVLVASPDSEAARPKLAANLAASYAETGQSVVVLSTSELPNVPRGPGPALEAAPPITPESVRAALAPTMLAGVQRLPIDGLVGTSGQLATRAPAVFAALRDVADIVIVETPSLLEVHHAGALARVVDVVVLVAEVGVTTTDEGAKSGELLQRLEAPVLGVALTETPPRTKRATNPRGGNVAPPSGPTPSGPTPSDTPPVDDTGPGQVPPEGGSPPPPPGSAAPLAD